MKTLLTFLEKIVREENTRFEAMAVTNAYKLKLNSVLHERPMPNTMMSSDTMVIVLSRSFKIITARIADVNGSAAYVVKSY
jgi:hypothetical protein